MRRTAKVDANQALIVRELRKLGATVQSLANIGQGCPDILVGWRNKNYAFEVKDGCQPPSKRKLTEDEVIWHRSWNGQVHVIYNALDALKVMEG